MAPGPSGRALLVLALVAAAAAAGCVGDDPVPGGAGREDPARQENASPSEPPESSGDGGEEVDGNGTPEEPPDRNRTREPGPVRPSLPGNLSMEGAEAVERTDRRVVFRWNGTLPASGGEGPADAAFDVPPGIPLRVNTSLDWQGSDDLDLRLRSEDIEHYCASAGPGTGGSDGGEACGVRTFARSAWDSWDLRVERGASGASDGETPFTAELSVEVADPWTGPPVEPAPPDPDAQADPGWPSLGEAGVRPGAKFEVGTANFVFSSPDNRTLYLGWIAHGVDGMEPGDPLTLNLPGGGLEATLVYCSWGAIEETVTCPEVDAFEHQAAANDFALVRLPDSARDRVHPAALFWGGPTGTAQPPAAGDQVLAFGNTDYRDGDQAGVNPLDPQRGIVRASGERGTKVNVLPPAVPGDSGSPVLAPDGAAVGTMSNLELTIPQGVLNGVANLGYAVDYMEEETGLDVELETWGLFEQPRARDLVGPAEGP